MTGTVAFWLTLFVFTLTYAGLALGRLPGLRTDRTGIALSGAAIVLATGLLRFDDAVKAVDFATLLLLLGMMIVVAYLRRAGFFASLADWSLSRFRSPASLLAVTMILSGWLSALLVNDVVCLALTPLVLNVARQMRLDPRPHLIGLAVASNVGSTATLTGNPQNMIIGGLSHIPYLRFAAKLAPVAILGLAVAYVVTLVVYRAALVRWKRSGSKTKTFLKQTKRQNLASPDGALTGRCWSRVWRSRSGRLLSSSPGRRWPWLRLPRRRFCCSIGLSRRVFIDRSTGACW